MERDDSTKIDWCPRRRVKIDGSNRVRDLVGLLKGCKRVGCKWGFETKCHSNENIKQHNAKLDKVFTKKDGID